MLHRTGRWRIMCRLCRAMCWTLFRVSEKEKRMKKKGPTTNSFDRQQPRRRTASARSGNERGEDAILIAELGVCGNWRKRPKKRWNHPSVESRVDGLQRRCKSHLANARLDADRNLLLTAIYCRPKSEGVGWPGGSQQ